MIKGSKICGISDLDTLNFIINHPYPPQFIGFICNYKKSSRYVGVEKLNELLKLDKKKSNFVESDASEAIAGLESLKIMICCFFVVIFWQHIQRDVLKRDQISSRSTRAKRARGSSR